MTYRVPKPRRDRSAASRNRHRWPRAGRCWLLVATFALAGCPGERAPAPTPRHEAAIEPPTAESEPEVAPRVSPPRAPMSVFSEEANLLLSLDVRAAAASPLYEALLAPQVDKAFGESLQQLRRLCSIELFTTVGRVFSAHVMDEQLDNVDGSHMFSVAGLRRERLRACMGRLTTEGIVKGYREEGSYGLVEAPSGPQWHVWLDATTVVLGTSMDRPRLQERMEAGSSLQNQVSMMDLAGLVDRNATLWGIFEIPPEAIVRDNLDFYAVYGWLHLGTTLDLRVGLRHRTREAARKTTEQFDKGIDQLLQQMGQLAKFLEGLEVITQDDDVILTLSYDKAQMEAFIEEMVPLLRGAL